ncbi:malic enzyme-like NAD(P)-binding protein [Fusibacter bizertensis]|uniref:Malic enzyme-like NAD(P)-binding protein n=1 Tax=Fusibacter bizertensis TaxID=1488331 RepID=A0ABT6N836_9FIRM|nr:malic enzyme-like NAD(P)-binding protein [Fusibacter bizertensis]MDH8676561.1 malic enzyme-like NAD(P)-binding protein [Fusibacter bizertensis]
MNYNQRALELHEAAKGKIEVTSKVKLESKDDLSMAYTPGVAEPCRKIAANPEDVYKYTSKGNLVAVVSDGSAVLGLGNIGAKAAIPVMEGKAILFKAFANVDAFPICVESQEVDSIVQTVVQIAPVFGGINLEDISSPRCVEVERKLKELLDIPVFHDDQHGTAIVVCSALINALKIVNKKIEEIKIVINGAGSAGNAIARMLVDLGAKNILSCDRAGIISRNVKQKNWVQDEIALITNSNCTEGTLADAMDGADVFIGVSSKDAVSKEMVTSMNTDSIVFAMANPDPEIMPDLAKEAGARIVGTGRSDFANQINNVLAFPGIFRGALDAKASDINEAMKVAAVYAIADLISADELNDEYIIPSALNKSIGEKVATAVYKAAVDSGVSRV